MKKRPGPVREPIPPEIERIVIYYAKLYPWYGYKKIAVICRRAGHKVKNRQALIPEDGDDSMTPYDVYVEGKVTVIPKWQGWAKGAKAKLDAIMTGEAA